MRLKPKEIRGRLARVWFNIPGWVDDPLSGWADQNIRVVAGTLRPLKEWVVLPSLFSFSVVPGF